MARNFNGSSGRIDLSVGACGVAFGGHTVAAIARSANDGASIKSLIAATSDASWQFFCRNGTIQFWNGAATDAFGGSCDFAIADSWCVVGVSKASGSATPRAHRIRIDQSGGVPNRHAAGDGNKANSGVPTGLRIGSQGPTPTDFYNGDIALVALWPAVLTDAQFESLAFGLDAWFQIAPLGLWLIDQDSTSQKVIDLTGGGANQSGINGTSIQAASVPFSYGARILIPEFAPGSASTVFGASSLDLSVAIATEGTLRAFSSSSLTETVAITTNGVRKRFGSASLALTATLSTAGFATHFGSSSLTQTVGATTGGTLSAFGACGTAGSLTITCSGIVGAFSSSSLTETVGLTSAGHAGHFGQSSLTENVGVATLGFAGHFGSTSLSETVSVTSSGVIASNTAFGSASIGLVAQITTAGFSTHFGQSAQTASIGITTSGFATHFGAAVLAEVVSIVTAAHATYRGAASIAEVVSITTEAVVGALGRPPNSATGAGVGRGRSRTSVASGARGASVSSGRTKSET